MQLLVYAAVAALIGAVGLSVSTADAIGSTADVSVPAGRSTVATPAPAARYSGLVNRKAPSVTSDTPATTSLIAATSITTATATAATAQLSQIPGSRLALPLAFGWPLSPRPTVWRRFEQPRSQWSRGHRGVDLLATTGEPVLSAGDGFVAFSGMVAGRGVITVAHAGGLRTSYEPVEARMAVGTPVRRGTRIAVVSTTAGHCVPLTCLHWGALSGEVYLDPLSLLGFGRPVLLPLG